MKIFEIVLLGVGLSMDAFAVAICKGLSSEKFSFKNAIVVGAWFGVFQALMPLIGYLLGNLVADLISTFDHWVAFVLLAFIGGKMIYEAIRGEEKKDASVSFTVMLPLAIGTSIDAMAAGITIALSDADIYIAIAIIGAITFVLSAVGVKLGSIFGAKFQKKAEIFGGIVLVALGLKILIEHLVAG